MTIVSAQFGRGKSWFINHFFNESNSGNEFNLVHLYPVNYSIASNQDTFELIKYDILLELASKNPTLFSEESTKVIAEKFPRTSGFIKNNWKKIIHEVIVHALKEFSHIDKVIPENVMREFVDTFEKPDAKELSDFVREQINQVGSIYEKNIITELINNELARIKQSKGVEERAKRNVLVIDDLDRIDPEHIFRLLNVFSAHLDQGDSRLSLKFDFDHVIFVCDIENLKELFAKKYGSVSSWQGYINKFYTNGYFILENKSLMQYFFTKEKNKLASSMAQIKWLDSEDALLLASDLIQFFIQKELISFRDLKHLEDTTFDPYYKERMIVFPYSKFEPRTCMYPYLPIWFGLLIKLFGGRNEFLEFIQKNKSTLDEIQLHHQDYYLQTLIPINHPELSEDFNTQHGWRSYHYDYVMYSRDLDLNNFNLFDEINMVLTNLPNMDSKRPDLLFLNQKEELTPVLAQV